MATEDKPVCPTCGASEHVRPILYGKPGPELMGQADRGVVVLGGCVIGPAAPAWDCASCAQQFR